MFVKRVLPAMSIFRGCLLVFISLGVSVAVAAQTVELKSVKVDAKIMRFPGISLDGVNYNALTFEYGVKGDLDILNIEDERSKQLCQGATRDISFLNVSYKGPEIIFRVKDDRSNRVLLLKPIDTQGVVAVGKGDCQLSEMLRANFDVQLSQWREQKKREVLAAAREEMELFMKKNTVLDYQDIQFSMYFFNGEGSRYAELNRVFDQARTAFDTSMQYGITQEAEFGLKKSIKAWEDVLSSLTSKTLLNEEEKTLQLALHRNLIPAYLYIRKFDMARRHDANALAQGMPANESMQNLILEMERRVILSPNVASDLALTANLYRFGQNAIRDKQLVEVNDFNSLKQTFSLQ